jgi:predicted TPR repeat methyltransferase
MDPEGSHPLDITIALAHARVTRSRRDSVMSEMEMIEAARAAFIAKNFSEAELNCRRVLREAPHAAPALRILGHIHSDRGDDLEALRVFRQALFFSPRFIELYGDISQLYYAMGRLEDLAQLLTEWTRVNPTDPEAQHMMAAITGKNVPRQCSEGYVQTHFDKFSQSFDSVLMQKLGYRGPKIVATALGEHRPSVQTQMDVLDAGCGTGLCGPEIRQWCRTLVGVDLSERMIEKARERACYDELVAGEICTLMESRAMAFDAIVSADVLIYFGALERFMQSAQNALRPGGILIATTESLPDDATDPYRLLVSGRYGHRKSYVTNTVQDAGFELLEIQQEPIRWELGTVAMGHRVVARRHDVGD